MVMDLLQSTCRETQAILIVASHDPALVQRFDTVFDLRGGRLEQAQDTDTHVRSAAVLA
jgi:ABC-type lipoprotein export system ATPase subunit